MENLEEQWRLFASQPNRTYVHLSGWCGCMPVSQLYAFPNSAKKRDGKKVGKAIAKWLHHMSRDAKIEVLKTGQ